MSETTITQLPDPSGFSSDPFTDVLRDGARKLIEQAIHAELATLMAAFSGEKLQDGRARLVRPGHLPEREVMTGIGLVSVKVPRVRDTCYKWAYIFGAVCPERGTTAALVMPHADAQAMNAHLVEISKTVAEGAHAILVLDGAGWQGSTTLCIPENITLLLLPPYAPELNPIENVRACLRANRLAISVFETDAEIMERWCDAWTFFAGDIEAIKSITSRDYAKAVKG